MSVTIVLVFGDKLSKIVPDMELLQWFHSYIGRCPQYNMVSLSLWCDRLTDEVPNGDHGGIHYQTVPPEGD